MKGFAWLAMSFCPSVRHLLPDVIHLLTSSESGEVGKLVPYIS